MLYTWETAEEINMKLAMRLRSIRRRKKISQSDLANQSGVSYGSIKRFEATGQISMLSLTRIAIALGISDEINSIFTDVGYASIQEVINESR